MRKILGPIFFAEGDIVKKQLIYGITVIALGLLITLGPQFLFVVCSAHNGEFALCHWTARAEIGMGMLIAGLGLCYIAFSDPKTQLGIAIGIFLSGIIVLGLPHVLIGGCSVKTMSCRKVAFPALTIEAAILLAYSAFMVAYMELRKKPA
jgi:hypothetical protein